MAGRTTTNIDGIRLLAATAVVVGHAYPLTGRPELKISWIPVSSLAVMVFFITSGWLISASWERDGDLLRYLRNRALRIFPGLIVVVAVTALVIGPLVTGVGTGEYFGSASTWTYLRNVLLWTTPSLGDVFSTTVHPTVNGSLWTLPIEFACYLALPFIGLVPARFRGPVTGLVAVGGVVGFHLVPPTAVALVAPLDSVCMFAGFFAAGACLRYLSGGSAEWFRTDVAALALLAWPVTVAVFPAHPVAVVAVFLPYAVIALGLASTPYLRQASRWGDFSYGIYLWGVPVQQLVVHRSGVVSMPVNLVVVLGVTTLLGVLSWRFVEKPALAFRALPPRRVEPAAELPRPRPAADETVEFPPLVDRRVRV